jgi:hypothetical protein
VYTIATSPVLVLLLPPPLAPASMRAARLVREPKLQTDAVAAPLSAARKLGAAPGSAWGTPRCGEAAA